MQVEYFFDPSLALPPDADTFDVSKPAGPPRTPAKSHRGINNDDDDDAILFSSRHLFMPCTIVKDIDTTVNNNNNGEYTGSVPALVKTSDGQLHKISDRKKLIALTAPEDYDGVPDVLHLPNVTEASLLHTLRLRYNRNEIYTSAGPILMSVNPYKTITMKDGLDLYAEERMLQYRNFNSNNSSSGSSMMSIVQALPTHLFQVAACAYNELLKSTIVATPMSFSPRKGKGGGEDITSVINLNINSTSHVAKNQSIVISGESGAGKTEATKKIMQYLARVTKSTTKDYSAGRRHSLAVGVGTSLEDRVLSSNPLLESFGNARTLKNDNSSRFGKFIKISFNTDSGFIVGASISNYLLEKTRITTQIDGERNYHIFYQIMSGSDDLAKFNLENGVAAFRYLGNRSTLKSRHDASAFGETMMCLDQIGLLHEEKNDVLGILAAVLHIGNIIFEVDKDVDDHSGEKAKITETSVESLKFACTFLDLDDTKVSEALLTKMLLVGGKTIHKAQNVVQASDKRDAFAKLVYSSLFEWLVKKINATLDLAITLPNRTEPDNSAFSPPRSLYKPPVPTGFIGVLDIYGFENFDSNGFEQLLINYANEKLQRYFNRHVFEVEQRMYSDEGVDWTYITFNDNQPCLDLIEGTVEDVGILSTLDDSGGMGTASERDVNFLAQIHQKFGCGSSGPTTAGGNTTSKKKKRSKSKSPVSKEKQILRHEKFITPKFGMDRDFIIIHYAGEVRYNITGFVEKNVETLSNELKELGSTSSNKFAQGVFAASGVVSAAAVADPGRRSALRGVSVASQFRTSLQMLVMDLECTQPHYVRCIKPNNSKAYNIFESGEVLRQLRYSGMMETIRIRREGYSHREDHKSFHQRYHLLLSSKEANSGEGIRHLVNVLSKRLSLTDAEWQIGHTKIFLKTELASKLDLLSKLRSQAAARVLTRFGRKIAHSQAGMLLTAWMRFRLTLIRKRRRINASSKIASIYRMHKTCKSYKVHLVSVIQLQSICRMAIASERLRVMRDPYKSMSFTELDALYTKELSRMENAVVYKDFITAAEIEKKLIPLRDAVESKRPLTRSVLDIKIAEVQSLLDDAISRKAFEECSPIQHKMEKLIRQREELPTIDEMKEIVRLAKQGVSDAAARRDFARAATAQAALDKAIKKLEDAMKSEGLDIVDVSSVGIVVDDRFQSRTDLEIAILKASKKVDDAISKKCFSKATKYQSELDEFESLRKMLPSVNEIESELYEVKAQMNGAIKDKNFKKADCLQNDVDKLEAKLEVERAKMESNFEAENANPCTPQFINENGETVTFTSRFELEKEMNRFQFLVQKSTSLRKFKEAATNQRFLDTLDELKPLLPTEQELRNNLAKIRTEMELAIQKKDFDTAEKLDKTVLSLEDKLEAERMSIPQSFDALDNTSVSAKAPPSVVKAPIKAPLRNSTNAGSSSTSSVNKLSSCLAHPFAKSTPVSKLRPKAPMISTSDGTVLSVVQMLASKRGDAAIIINSSGELAGIITDTDVTRRVVAKDLNASRTSIADVMTPNPSCVTMSDSATDALVLMVENRFRHLPVTDASGSVVGVLDIAKCLNDAISKLEHSKDKCSSAAEEALNATFVAAGGGEHAAALRQLLGPLMSQAFGGQTAPTLRTVLAGKPSTIVSPSTSIQETGHKMAEARKAALVVENGRLIGIFGFKDMMTRAVAKELPLEFTAVSTVMTPNPESVSPDTTVLEALQIMHDNKFLTLPVCESNGSVIGVVDVMDCVYGSGGAEGWRSIFAKAIDCDDLTDSASVPSRQVKSAKSGSVSGSVARKKDDRPVSKLRPKKPILMSDSESVLSIAQALAAKRGDAALIFNVNGGLAGIITDTDVTRRVVAKHLPPRLTKVSDAMTANPTCVLMSDSAMEALCTMVDNRFRHLPVIDANGNIVGCLDIAKCLNDAISKLERAQDKSGSAAQVAVKQISFNQATTLQALLGPILAHVLGGKSFPTLRSVLAGRSSNIVSPNSSLQDVGFMMAEARKAALVVESDKLVGVFGFKDMMTRAVAKELPLDSTPVSAVMTPNPEYVSPETTVLEALQIMHDNKFLTLPVCEDDGRVIGLVDVMDCVHASGGAEGWKSLFASALDEDDDSSVFTNDRSEVRPLGIPLQVEIGKRPPSDDDISESLTLHNPISAVESRAARSAVSANLVVYKIVDDVGQTYVIRAGTTIESINKALDGKISNFDPSRTVFKYVDDEGDEVFIKSDECVEEAVSSSVQMGNKNVKLSIKSRKNTNKTFMVAGGAGFVALVGVALIVLRKPKK